MAARILKKYKLRKKRQNEKEHISVKREKFVSSLLTSIFNRNANLRVRKTYFLISTYITGTPLAKM